MNRNIRRAFAWWRPLVLPAILAGCRGPVGASAGPAPAYDYAIAPPAAGSWTLRVQATFERAPSALIVAPEDLADVVRDVSVAEGSVTRSERGWVAPVCTKRCTLDYAIDLDALAAGCHRIDCSRRVGDAVLGVASTWLLRPEPTGDATIRVRLRGGDPSRFATGLRRSPEGGFALRAVELGESSYTAFGGFRRSSIAVPGATVDVVFLGAPLAMGDESAAQWIRAAAGCVAGLFGKFPTDATVFVVPVPGARQVVFGRVMSLTGASVVLLFGDETRPESVRDDWVVVHELFHLGCPSFEGEGRWLEEGLATYYEPILRARAGWTSKEDLWGHFAREMPRGLRKDDDPAALEARDDIDSTYWGGALFALLADVSTRDRTAGARSLDDALRALLARAGDATHVARVADFVRIADEATGTRAVSDVYDAWAVHGQPVDLAAMWRRLGVEPAEHGVSLASDAPLADLRRAIETGDPTSPVLLRPASH